MIEALIGFSAIFVLALLRIPLAWVLFGVGSLACIWAYRQLGLARATVGAP